MTQTMFSTAPDAFVMDKVRENFDFLTGASRPPAKTNKTHVDGNTIEDHFVQGASYLNMVIFFAAVRVAKEQGLLNVVETAMCDEVIDILSKG